MQPKQFNHFRIYFTSSFTGLNINCPLEIIMVGIQTHDLLLKSPIFVKSTKQLQVIVKTFKQKLMQHIRVGVNEDTVDCETLLITARVRSTTGRYCFHRCLSVHRGGEGGSGQVPPPPPPRGSGYPPSPPGGTEVRVPPRGVPKSGYPPGGGTEVWVPPPGGGT